MAFTYHKILRQAAIRINALSGVTATALETSYTTAPLTATQITSVDFPITSIKDACLSAVAKIIRTYASVPDHPFRNTNLSVTNNIAHKAVIPAVNSASKPIVGVYGAIRDATTFDALTEQPIQVINSIVANDDSFFKGSYFYYKIVGNRIYHTRTNVVIDVCTFDEATERTAIDANSNCPLPDACFDLAWTGTLSYLTRDEEWLNQSQVYRNYFENGLAEIQTGKVSIQPAPTLVNSAVPSVS